MLYLILKSDFYEWHYFPSFLDNEESSEKFYIIITYIILIIFLLYTSNNLNLYTHVIFLFIYKPSRLSVKFQWPKILRSILCILLFFILMFPSYIHTLYIYTHSSMTYLWLQIKFLNSNFTHLFRNCSNWHKAATVKLTRVIKFINVKI